MLVTVEDQGKLKRKLSVEVPLADVRQAYDRVFTEIRTQVRVPGFRPGKFPRALAEKRFQSLMAQEAAQNLVPKYFGQALKEKELRPATEPRFQNLKIDKTLPLTFDVEFEIFPPFELLPPSGFTLADKPVAVTAEQVEARIADLRKRNATLEDKGGAAAEAGDTVTFDFEGRLDGTVFPGGSAQGQRIEVGAGQFLKDFDTQFPGIAAGQTKSFDVTFPADYGEATLAGKTAQFTVTAHKVEKAVPAELNAGFFKQFGAVSSEAELRDHIRAQLEKEQERAHLNGLQQALADQIRAQYGFDVPETSVDELLHRYEHELAESQPDAVQDPQKLEALKEERRKVILGDLRLGFVANAYADKSGIQVDPAQLRQRFMLQAYMMQQNPSELLKTGYGEQMLSQIRQQMLIAKTLGHLVHVVLGKEVPPEFAPGAPPAEGDDDPSGRELEDHDHEGHDHAAHAHEEHAH